MKIKAFFQRPLSIKTKLIWVTSMSVGFSLFLVLALFIYQNSKNEWSKLTTRLTIQAEIIANNCVPAVIFEDTLAANEILTALKADEAVIYAKISTPVATVFADYEKQNTIEVNQFFDSYFPLSKWLSAYRVIDFPIFYNDTKIGQVQLTASLIKLYRNNIRYGLIAFLTSVISMLLTLILSHVLLKKIIDPIIKLTRTAKKVRNLSNYSVRAEVTSTDEVGELTRSFNEMLEEIQRKDQVLEKMVAERTAELIKLNKKLQHQAYHDPLTGLANRMLFDDRLQVVLTHAQRFGYKFAVLYFDLDHFKTINDTLGHDTGDKLLIEVSNRMKALIRKDDTLCRVGGDEFTLILNKIESTADIELVTQKMLTAFSNPFFCNAHEISVSSSIGISMYPDHGNSLEQLKHYADLAMYHCKRNGRSNYCFFTDHMQKDNAYKNNQRILLKRHLKTAIKYNELQIYYQPQVDMQHRIIALEALIRWKNAENKMISPDIFIPLAEESGLIQGLEEWAFAEICQHYAQWNDEDNLRLKISINISGHRLRQQSFNDYIDNTLEQFGLSPSFLIFELTEKEMMQNMIETEKVLNKLHDKGIKIAVDHFGSGYTSLNYLQQLPIDEFKIDAELIHHLESHYHQTSVIQAILGLANSLNKTVVAMGVEKEDQAAYFQNRKCHAMQGYYFAKPMSEKKVAKLLKNTQHLPVKS